MLHHIKFSFLSCIRAKDLWLILGFYLLMGIFINMIVHTNEPVSMIPDEGIFVAVVNNENLSFLNFLKEVEGLHLQVVLEEEALHLLEAGDIAGIFFTEGGIHLTVAQNGWEEQFLVSLGNEYLQIEQALKTLAEQNPEGIPAAMARLSQDLNISREMDLKTTYQDPALIANFLFLLLVGLSGIFRGFKRCISLKNQLTPLGSRRLMGSVGKLSMFIGEVVGTSLFFLIQTFLSWTCYFFIFRIVFPGNPFLMALLFFMNCLLAISVGAFVAIVVPGREKTREQILEVMAIAIGVLGALRMNLRNVPIMGIVEIINPWTYLFNAQTALAAPNFSEFLSAITVILGITAFVMGVTAMVLRRNAYANL